MLLKLSGSIPKTFFLLLVCSSLVSSSLWATESSKQSKNCLLVLHGLARTKFSMKSVESYFKDNGYIVFNKSYPSTKKRIEDLSRVVGDGIEDCKSVNATGIYFVTHSMGGILVRHYFQSHKPEDPIKAVVMLSPPNHGSEIVDAFRNQKWFKWYNGPAGLQLGTEATSLPRNLKPIKIPVGIITGNVSSDPWFAYLFDKPNDGKVTVESAKLTEMKDILVVPQGHTFIMNSKDVHAKIKTFFETLSF